MKKRVIIFSGLVNVDKNLVGTAVIYKKMADVFLSKNYEVFMVVPELNNLKAEKINFQIYNEKNNKKLIDSASIVIFGAYPPTQPLIYAYEKRKLIITYLWSIAPIGSLEFKDFSDKKKQVKLHRYISASYNLSLLLSDKIFCRDEGVRKLILGSLISLGRANLENYELDRSFSKLVEIASFGIDNLKPKKTKGLYRSIVPGINNKDFILLWNGGVWNWNDGETLIRAMEKLKNENVKLVFQGFKHPGKGKEISDKAQAALNLAIKLKLKDKNIFFIEDWSPYKERANFLLEANVGVVSSPNIPEANLFLKTRIYDYLWAELPTILNDSEAFASIIKEKNLGLVAKTGDIDSWVINILALKNNKKIIKKIKANIKEYKKEIEWKNTLKPLINFIKNPEKLKDKNDKTSKLLQDNIKTNKKLISNFS